MPENKGYTYLDRITFTDNNKDKTRKKVVNQEKITVSKNSIILEEKELTIPEIPENLDSLIIKNGEEVISESKIEQNIQLPNNIDEDKTNIAESNEELNNKDLELKAPIDNHDSSIIAEEKKEKKITLPNFIKKGLEAINKTKKSDRGNQSPEFDISFEEEKQKFGNLEMTYRELYIELFEYIDDLLQNDSEGKLLCEKNYVSTSIERCDLINIIFSIIKVNLDLKEINIQNISNTALYLGVSEKSINLYCKNKENFEILRKFSVKIYSNYFKSEHESNEITESQKKEAINTNYRDYRIDEMEKPTEFVNEYQQIFYTFKGKVATIENGKEYAVDMETLEATCDEDILRKQKIACFWYCSVCFCYKKKKLNPKDWQDLETLLETIKNSINDNTEENLKNEMISQGINEDIINLLLINKNMLDLFVVQARNDIVETLLAERKNQYKQ